MAAQEKQPTFPKFSFRSALLLFLAGIVGGVVIPYLFYRLHWDTRIAVMLFLPILISGALAYGQCFFETQIGLGMGFYRTFFFSLFIIETASYLWLFKGFIF